MGQIRTAEGHCPGPETQPMALRTGVSPGTASGITAADATQAGVVPDLVPHTLLEGCEPSLFPQQSGCWSIALDWGSWRAHHTSPTKQRGMTIPSPCPRAFMYYASCHWSQRKPCTGDCACTARKWPVFPVMPLLLKIVDATAPNEIQGNAD